MSIFDRFRLTGKRLFITGGSRGLGREMAVAIADAGADVILVGRDQPSLEKTAGDIRALGRQAWTIAADVSRPDECEKACQSALERHGPIDILINNAGITKDGLLFRMSEDDWNNVMATNLTSCYHFTKLVGRPMTQKRWGRIINITSVVGLMGNPGQANYCAAKAGMIGFTKSIAKEFAARNITVNAVAPGFIKTDMTAGLPEEAGEKLMSVIPLKRLGEAADIAHMVAFLASEEAGYITGQVFTVDGGMVM